MLWRGLHAQGISQHEHFPVAWQGTESMSMCPPAHARSSKTKLLMSRRYRSSLQYSAARVVQTAEAMQLSGQPLGTRCRITSTRPLGSFPGSIMSAFFISFSLGFHSVEDTYNVAMAWIPLLRTAWLDC